MTTGPHTVRRIRVRRLGAVLVAGVLGLNACSTTEPDTTAVVSTEVMSDP